MKLVPIYTLSIKNGTNYTIFLEQGYQLVYKEYRDAMNNNTPL
ncbi:hypothetical protein [Oceanobacillus sp. 1P07AA]